MTSLPDWLTLHRGNAPLIVGFPHTGTNLPEALADRFVSPWLERPGNRGDAPRRCGYEIALECAKNKPLDLPGIPGRPAARP